MSSPLLAGFNVGYNAVSAWRQRKEGQDKIDKQVEEMKANTFQLGQSFDKDRADGVITDQEYNDRMSWAITVGNEMMNNVKTLYGDARKMSKEELNMELKNLDSLYNLYVDADYQDLDGIKELVSGFKYEKARFQGESYIKVLEGRGQKESKAEMFKSFRECKEAYPNVEPKFDAKSGMYHPGSETEPKTYEFQAKIRTLDEMLVNKEIDEVTYKRTKERLLGGAANIEGGYKQPSLGQIQTMEQDMLNAKDLNDLHNKLRQWKGANLDPEKIKVYDKQWTDYQVDKRTKAIKSTIKQLEKLLGGKGTLRPSDELTLFVSKKEQTRLKEDWYKALYEQYNKQLAELAKITDISDYKKLISPEKMKTVGWNLDIFTEGIEMKDWKGIWQ